MEKLVRFIDNEYLVEILVDNLPGIMRVGNYMNTSYFEHGYPLGGVLVPKGNTTVVGYALNNHLDFTIYYNENEVKDSVVIVGFEISPRRFAWRLFFPLVSAITVSLRLNRPVIATVFLP